MRIAELSKATLQQAAWLPLGLIGASLLAREWDPLLEVLLDGTAAVAGLAIGGILLLHNRRAKAAGLTLTAAALPSVAPAGPRSGAG